jgi:hypothetical protein
MIAQSDRSHTLSQLFRCLDAHLPVRAFTTVIDMPFTLIKGNFRIVGAAPDGDSVRFYPTDRKAFAKAGLSVRLNSRGGVQLRLEGIDALETHYRPQARGAARPSA